MGSIPSIVDERDAAGADRRRDAAADGDSGRAARSIRAAAYAFDRCRRERPTLMSAARPALAACWLHATAAMTPHDARALLELDRRRRATSTFRRRGSTGVLEAQAAADRSRRSTASASRSPSGETLGLVGESGCGKSTVARLIVGLYRADAREDLVRRPAHRCRRRRARAAAHDADDLPGSVREPQSALARRATSSPSRSARTVLRKRRARSTTRVAALLEQVGLAGGRRRASIRTSSPAGSGSASRSRARWRRNPAFLVCDEPTSALDVSVQAQVLNLMRELQRELGLTYLFISHNLAVVHHVADRVGVMYLGRIVELAPTRDAVRDRRSIPYTRMLLDAVPDLALTGKPRTAVAGEVPNPLDPPPGCAFHPRCPHANERCRAKYRCSGALAPGAGAMAACHAVEEGRLRRAGTACQRHWSRQRAARRIGYNSPVRGIGRAARRRHRCGRKSRRLARSSSRRPPPRTSRRTPNCASPRSSWPASSRSSIRPPSRTPGQLVGIVGPNGCGKSNVIDAVRWVLGESKASALRGESMQDVIFNGAGERKPVGRASVELYFDNSQGRIGGQWGQYAELVDQARADARRRLDLLHQQHPGAPPRHPRPVPRHRARAARLRDHRAGDDLARHRGEARGAARVPRGSRGRVQVQRAAQGDRGPARRHAREPRARRGHPRRARQRSSAGSKRRRRSPPNTASSKRGSSRRSTCCGSPSSRTRCASRERHATEIANADRRRFEALQAELRAAENAAGDAARRPLRGRRRAAREAGRVLRGERRGHAARAAARVRARERRRGCRSRSRRSPNRSPPHRAAGARRSHADAQR